MWKDLDATITEAQAPIEALEVEHRQSQTDLNLKIGEAQRLSQDLNISVDKVIQRNKEVER